MALEGAVRRLRLGPMLTCVCSRADATAEWADNVDLLEKLRPEFLVMEEPSWDPSDLDIHREIFKKARIGRGGFEPLTV